MTVREVVKGTSKFCLEYPKRAFKLKKRFEISMCFAFHLCTYYYMYPNAKFLLKMHACDAAAGVQNCGKMSHLSQQQRPLLEISYILLFSIMTLYYHRLNQISSLEEEI